MHEEQLTIMRCELGDLSVALWKKLLAGKITATKITQTYSLDKAERESCLSNRTSSPL